MAKQHKPAFLAIVEDAKTRISETTVEAVGKSFVIRSQTRGQAGKAIQAAGIALGPAVRLFSKEGK